MWGVGPVHLVRVAEGPASGQRVHNLDGREAVSRAAGPLAWCPPPPRPDGAHLGHLAGLGGLGVLEGRHVLAGELQVALARGLEAAVAHAAVVQAPALPVLPLQLPVAADAEPLRGAPADGGGGERGHVHGGEAPRTRLGHARVEGVTRADRAHVCTGEVMRVDGTRVYAEGDKACV